jgi:molecular chaperone DnaK (HSP70)
MMDDPTGTLNLKTCSTKLQAYEALYRFNRLIETTLESLENLERLGFLPGEDLNEHKIRIEHTRAQANEDLIDRLQEYETEESVRFDRMESELEKQRKDPDDVFFAARDRKKEIKQQITELQEALERQSPRPKRQNKKAQK